LAVDCYLENAGYAFDEFDFFGTAFHQSGLRTEGSRFIVSRHAVFDPDLHFSRLSQQKAGERYHDPRRVAMLFGAAWCCARRICRDGPVGFKVASGADLNSFRHRIGA
jgi:hypothetical protein